MKNNFSFDQSVLRILYRRHRKLITPSIIILTCITLFLLIIFPQIGELSSLQDEEKNTRQKIKVIKENMSFLGSISDSDVDSNFRALLLALSQEKDFGGIFSALSYAAGSSGVTLSDYGFSIGDLSTKSAQLSNLQSIPIDLSINGNLQSIKRFLQKLYETFPVSEVTSVQISGNTARIATIFYYYKPFPSNFRFAADMNLSKLSDKDRELLIKISSFRPGVLEVEHLQSSAIRSKSPF